MKELIENSQRRNLALLLILLVAVTAAYARVASFPFLEFDDQAYILNNEAIRHWSSLSFIFGSDLWQGRMAMSPPYYRPIFVSWGLTNFKLYGLHPALWHLSSVAIYLIAVWLAWMLARKLTDNDFAAIAAAALFALHPTHVESVAWLIAVVEPLTSIFFFGAFLLYLRWRENRQRQWLFSCAAVTLLALLTKETGAALLFLIPCFEFLFPLTHEEPELRRKRLVSLIQALAVVALFYGVARTIALWGMPTHSRNSISAVLRTAPLLLTTFLKQALWPVRLGMWYDQRVVASLSFSKFYLPLTVCLAYVGCTIWALFRNRRIAFPMIWWLACLGPLALGIRGFLETDFIHDRYGFMGSYGLCVLAGLGMSRLAATRKVPGFQPAAYAALAVIVAVFGWLTAAQTRAWSSNFAVYAHAAEVSPDSYAAQLELGSYLVQSGRRQEGFALLRQTAARYPDIWQVDFTIGMALASFKMFDEANPLLQRAVQLNPKTAGVYIAYADVLGRQNRTADAVQLLREGLPLVDHPEDVRKKITEVQDPDFYRRKLAEGPRL